MPKTTFSKANGHIESGDDMFKDWASKTWNPYSTDKMSGNMAILTLKTQFLLNICTMYLTDFYNSSCRAFFSLVTCLCKHWNSIFPQ